MNTDYNKISNFYKKAISTPSDINEHIETLKKYADECSHITECGVREIVSSWAFAESLKNKNNGKLVQIDTKKSPNIQKFIEINKSVNTDVIFYEQSDLECPIESTDLFFIDTWHVYGQLKRELDRWHKSVKKYIIMHDTEIDGIRGETIRNRWDAEKQSKETGIPINEINKGLKPAIDEFLEEHSEWKIDNIYKNCNGLTVLKRYINRNTNYDLIITVIASRSHIYDQLMLVYWKPFIKYLKHHKYRIKIFLIFGNVNIDDLHLDNEDVIINNTKENLIPGILIKTLNSFDYIHNNYEYKHILRTNLSSFFILEQLINVHKSLSHKNIYAGMVGNYYNISFVSGTGFWISSDNIEFLLDNKLNLDHNLIDDVAIGKLLQKHNKTPLQRYDLTNNIYNPNILDKIIESKIYHIRIKNPLDRSIDVKYMKNITSKLFTYTNSPS